jgi:hypothetical protein
MYSAMVFASMLTSWLLMTALPFWFGNLGFIIGLPLSVGLAVLYVTAVDTARVPVIH